MFEDETIIRMFAVCSIYSMSKRIAEKTLERCDGEGEQFTNYMVSVAGG